MSKVLTILFLFTVVVSLNAQDIFLRSSSVPTLQYEPGGGGFGDIVAGVDFDGDGLPEIYACNTNSIDRDGELVPKIYKFEWNEGTATWDSVWGAIPELTLQNTWPALTSGDMDKDGKYELYWSPVNYDPYPELPRVLVYESVGDGSDNMGVDDGFGGFLPNASTPIVEGDGVNLRPIKSVVADVDNDGTDELVFCDRGTVYHYGILSVDDIPDLGGGTETWTLEASGLNDILMNGSGSIYDFSIVDGTIFFFAGSGLVYPVINVAGIWSSLPPQSGVANEDGSFKGTAKADLDGDGTDEIVLGGWANPAVIYVLKVEADTLRTIRIGEVPGAMTFNGAASGDLDGDGDWDFVFGTRGSPAATPNNAVFRVEYHGEDITDSANYSVSIIDSLLVPAPGGTGGQLDVVYMANLDDDTMDEVIYTQGYTRGVANDTTADIAIVEFDHTTDVKLVNRNIPSQYYVNQNYPNPFNPSTTIQFGITNEVAVELKVFNILGQEVMTLVNGETMKAGIYNVSFKASDLASGTYVYRLKAGNYITSKKMVLLK